jgi:hypothetical protein
MEMEIWEMLGLHGGAPRHVHGSCIGGLRTPQAGEEEAMAGHLTTVTQLTKPKKLKAHTWKVTRWLPRGWFRNRGYVGARSAADRVQFSYIFHPIGC